MYRKGQMFMWSLILVLVIIVIATVATIIYFNRQPAPEPIIIYLNDTNNDTNIEPPNVIHNNLTYINDTNNDTNNDTKFTIANWNLQIFGQSKAGNLEVMDFYDEKMSNYDIIFVQEIRDSEGTAFTKLCSMLEGYKCNISQRDGRSISKEQIGVIYKEDYELIAINDLPDPNDVWERSPTKVVFNISGFVFTAYNAHLKPDDVLNELIALYNVVENNGNVVVLGDFNAACAYYNTQDTAFDDWKWLITDEMDTTVAKTDCAYDRIIVNNNMFPYIINSGIDSEGINTTYSDHYIVFAEVRPWLS